MRGHNFASSMNSISSILNHEARTPLIISGDQKSPPPPPPPPRQEIPHLQVLTGQPIIPKLETAKSFEVPTGLAAQLTGDFESTKAPHITGHGTQGWNKVEQLLRLIGNLADRRTGPAQASRRDGDQGACSTYAAMRYVIKDGEGIQRLMNLPYV